MTELTYKRYGMMDAAGHIYTIDGHFKDQKGPFFILPHEVVQRAAVIYDMEADVLIKCRWADPNSEEVKSFVGCMFRTLSKSSTELKEEFSGTKYGSRTHHIL